MMIAKRLSIPDNTCALLFDMDGVLLDTLTLDLSVCNTLLQERFKKPIRLSRAFIRSIFAYHPPEFWKRILTLVNEEYGIDAHTRDHMEILEAYNRMRNEHVFSTNPGIPEILEEAARSSLKIACVSNNPTKDVETILEKAGIAHHFDAVIGNDMAGLKKKPAPDTYIFAAKKLGVSPDECVVIEDSLLGAQAGFTAGCHTVGVATGSADARELIRSGWVHRVYTEFLPHRLALSFGNVTRKNIFTPNEFVSHMVEHIAWRMGCEIDLARHNDDWFSLGNAIGTEIGKFHVRNETGAALGMIDDGSAEVVIRPAKRPEVGLKGASGIDIDWFSTLRCEQLDSGKPLIEMIRGMAKGMGKDIDISLCSLEDPHHSWEGIFRSIGIAAARIYKPDSVDPDYRAAGEETFPKEDGPAVQVLERSALKARILRKTAESSVEILVDFSGYRPPRCGFEVSSGISVEGFVKLLDLFSRGADIFLSVDFTAVHLSSSHVVLEDIGLVLGRALKEILVIRMNLFGAEGAGSNVFTPEDLEAPVRTGISVEGRKFWKIIGLSESHEKIRRDFIIGHTLSDGLFSEDLDDFIDGLSGGLGCSIVIHLAKNVSPAEGWPLIYEHLGTAVKTAFAVNPFRKGVPPGVKATLA